MWDTSGPRPTPGATPAVNPSKVMGRFRCEARLSGEGPFETYRARVGGLGGFDQVFALTALVPGALARRPHAAEALLRTARATMRLKDPRIAAVQECGLAPGSAYVVAEHVHGITLRELVDHVEASGQIPAAGLWSRIVAGLGAEIAGGLAAAHAALPAVAHGGLCLTNVMITPQGSVKLLDLGLYAAVHTPTEIAQAPSRRGLVAPELATATGFAPAADLFAMAAVLQRLLGPAGGADAAPELGVTSPLPALLRSLLAEDPALRPSATVAELALREIAKDPRGDAPRELTAFVRTIMRQRPAGDAGLDDGTDDSAAPEMPAAFSDEPTAVVDVSLEAKSPSLAAILRELRGQERDDEAAEFVDQAAARAAAAGVIEPDGGALPDSGATRLAPLPLVSVPAAPLPMSNTPLGGFSSAAPPAPDDAVMDEGPESDEGEQTMVSLSLPSPVDLDMSDPMPGSMAAVASQLPPPEPSEVYLPFHDDDDEAAEAEAAASRPSAPSAPPGGFAGPSAAADAAVAAAATALEAPGASGVWERLAVGASLSSDALGALPTPPAPASGEPNAPDPTEFPAGTFDASEYSGAHVSAARLRAALHAGGSSAPSPAPLPPSDADDLARLAGSFVPQPNAPRNLLADLTSGEISASLPRSIGEARSAPDDVVSVPVRDAVAAAPEAIKFAEFSMALPMRSDVPRAIKREKLTPADWRPTGDLDGPAPAKEPSTQRVIYDFATRFSTRKRNLAIVAALLTTAATVALLWP